MDSFLRGGGGAGSNHPFSHPGLLDYKRELNAYERARLQRTMWDDRQVFDENRYNYFAPRGPHYIEYKMCGDKMCAKQKHMDLDRPIKHTGGDRHGECSSELRTHRNFTDLCADRLPSTPPRPCNEADRQRRAERQLARDLAAEEKAQVRLRQRRERQAIVEAIITPQAGRSLKQRQRAARESRYRAVVAMPPPPRAASPTGSPRARSPALAALLAPAAAVPCSTSGEDATGAAVVAAAAKAHDDASSDGTASEADPAAVAAAAAARMALYSSELAVAETTAADTVASHREAWERYKHRFGEGAELDQARSERQQALRNYVPSMGDQGVIHRVPANRKLPGKRRLSSPRCENTFRTSLRDYPSPRAPPGSPPRSPGSFRGALWPADRSGGRLLWGGGRQAVRV